MSYEVNFQLADDFLDHLDSTGIGEKDPFVSSRYIGFMAVAAVTVYELSIKQIYIDFAHSKHAIFGDFVKYIYDRLNGQIRIDHLKDKHLARFGTVYKDRFSDLLDKKEKDHLRRERVSLKTSYGNIIIWRHQFAHQGQIPSGPTYDEVRQSYILGKHVIHCLAMSLVAT